MKMLHTMLRVGDLQRSIRFYTDVMGMQLLRQTDRPDQKYSLAFVGYDSEDKSTVLELTYNYGIDHYDLGGAFGPAPGLASASSRPELERFILFSSGTTGHYKKVQFSGALRDARLEAVIRQRGYPPVDLTSFHAATSLDDLLGEAGTTQPARDYSAR